jgi:hypothetical protein
MISDPRKTPWPWFGGKADAAELVWSALGDVDHYVEPFAGSLAVLLRRPHPANRTYHSETDTEHAELEARGWRVVEWFRAGFLKGGMGNQRGAGATQQHRERLWMSPHCLGALKAAQGSLFARGGAA